MAPYKDKPLVELLPRFPLGLAVHAGCAEFCGAGEGGSRSSAALPEGERSAAGARPPQVQPGADPSRAGVLGPAVGVRGCAEGGAALGGRCGFISAAGRDARRRQGAASNRRRRGPAAPSPAQPSPTRPAAAGGRPRREPGARGEGGEAARTARRRPEGEERAGRRAAGS